MSGATPRPWDVTDYSLPGRPWYVAGGDTVVCDVLGESPQDEAGRANARLIVQAVNSHDALVAACEAALRIKELWLPPEDVVDSAHREEAAALYAMKEQIVAALALAKGGTK